MTLNVEGKWLQKGEGGQPLDLRIPKLEVRLKIEAEGRCDSKGGREGGSRPFQPFSKVLKKMPFT